MVLARIENPFFEQVGIGQIVKDWDMIFHDFIKYVL